MQITLKQIEAFVWVADLASFRGAAERLNTTQPNISGRITALEGLLGGALFDRAGTVRLTARGAALLPKARAVLDAVEGLAEASGGAAAEGGVLRLGVTEMIVHSWLQDYLRALADRFPGLSVELTVDLSANLEKELAARTIDLALQNAPFQRRVSGSVELGQYPLLWVAKPGLFAGRVTTDDLVAQPILTHFRTTRLYQEVAAHLAERRDLSPRLVPSSNLAACLQMTLQGMGVATLPKAMAAAEIRAGRLEVVNYEWVPDPFDFFARFEAERASPRLVEAAELAQSVAANFDYEI